MSELHLFAPFGIGYAIGWKDSMELDLEDVELLIEEKRRSIDSFFRKKR